MMKKEKERNTATATTAKKGVVWFFTLFFTLTSTC